MLKDTVNVTRLFVGQINRLGRVWGTIFRGRRHKGGWGWKSPSGVQGQSPWWGFGNRERSRPKALSILQIFGCQTMHNFVYLAKLHEPLVKHEKKPI